jgi:adenosylhomocysteine nucleosidase
MNEAPKVIVLISADAEWRAVQTLFAGIDYQKSPFGEWFLTRIGDQVEHFQIQSGLDQSSKTDTGYRVPVIFFHGGWGKIAAAASTQYVIDLWQPELLINLGTCGGFEGQVEQGMVILASQTIVYDIIELMGDFDAHIAHYSTIVDSDWLDEEALPFPVRKTLLVSGDRDLAVAEIPGLNARYGAIAGDWESGSIAWVAGRNHTRLVILRGVSDVVGSVGSEAYGNLEYFAASTKVIMAKLIAALPGCLAQARQFLD